MRTAVLMFVCVLVGCAGEEVAAVCGEGDWEGFACDHDVDQLSDVSGAAYNEAFAASNSTETLAGELAEQLSDIEEQVDALETIERTLHPLEIPSDSYSEPYMWDDVDMGQVHDIHVLWEVRDIQEGDSIPHPDDSTIRCEVTLDGYLQARSWNDEWSEDVGITPDGRPEVELPEMWWVSSTCGEEISPGQYMALIAPFETVTLVVDWLPE